MDHPLTQFRADKKLTQELLGEQLGVAAMTISRWERGEAQPRRKLWPKIRAATGLDPISFFNFEKRAAE